MLESFVISLKKKTAILICITDSSWKYETKKSLILSNSTCKLSVEMVVYSVTYVKRIVFTKTILGW